MARFALVTLTCAVIGTVGALEVTTPSKGSVYVVAGSTHTVQWEGTGESRFGIDLFFCGSSCLPDDCGEWVANLCPLGEAGCPDSAGDYDVVMPEPKSGTSNTGYKIRVTDINDEESADCSEPFTLLPSAETTTVGEVNEPTLVVISPMYGDMAVVCMEYTVEWDYDDGFGSPTGHFSIDLFEADGLQDCGTFYSALCDQESIGCKDSHGDYDIAIPCDLNTGEYKIRVGVFDDDSTFDCSDTFTILGSTGTTSSMTFGGEGVFGGEDMDLSMSSSFTFEESMSFDFMY
ncbi:unnamed protein product [Ascophyllum nodosum]